MAALGYGGPQSLGGCLLLLVLGRNGFATSIFKAIASDV